MSMQKRYKTQEQQLNLSNKLLNKLNN